MVDLNEPVYLQAMELGMEASHHIHDIAAGGVEALSSEDLKAIPVLKPPKKSFCPKCGSDIHAHTMLQWRKWRDHSGEVVQLQTQAGMETAIIQTAAHFMTSTQALETQVGELQAALDAADPDAVKEAYRVKARTCHPDVSGADPEAFKRLGMAREEVLQHLDTR